MNGPDLKALRRSLRFSVDDASVILNISHRTYRRWEDSKHDLEPHPLCKAVLLSYRNHPDAVDALPCEPDLLAEYLECSEADVMQAAGFCASTVEGLSGDVNKHNRLHPVMARAVQHRILSSGVS